MWKYNIVYKYKINTSKPKRFGSEKMKKLGKEYLQKLAKKFINNLKKQKRKPNLKFKNLEKKYYMELKVEHHVVYQKIYVKNQ